MRGAVCSVRCVEQCAMRGAVCNAWSSVRCVEQCAMRGAVCNAWRKQDAPPDDKQDPTVPGTGTRSSGR
eukprot:1146761-Rhodomonas_salina.3